MNRTFHREVGHKLLHPVGALITIKPNKTRQPLNKNDAKVTTSVIDKAVSMNEAEH
jgi:hypothetical protein